MNENFINFLEESWLFIFFICIIFIFILSFRDLKLYTRKQKPWRRASYQKTFPKIMLSYQHYNRKLELLSVTNHNLCLIVQNDLISYLKVIKDYTNEEIISLLQKEHELNLLFQNEKVVLFFMDIKAWMKSIEIKRNLIKKIAKFFKKLDQSEREDDVFFIELALVINNFRKALEPTK